MRPSEAPAPRKPLQGVPAGPISGRKQPRVSPLIRVLCERVGVRTMLCYAPKIFPRTVPAISINPTPNNPSVPGSGVLKWPLPICRLPL